MATIEIILSRMDSHLLLSFEYENPDRLDVYFSAIVETSILESDTWLCLTPGSSEQRLKFSILARLPSQKNIQRLSLNYSLGAYLERAR